jgi:nucleoid-associated protein YgaU
MNYAALVISTIVLVSCTSKTKKTPMAEDNISLEQSAPVRKVEQGQYKVEKGDTYMWIAYKIYGDYKRWREMERNNPDKKRNKLRVGDFVNYEMPAKEFNWRETGIAYRIKKDDGLAKISQKVYGTPTLWRRIWLNNRRMIPNPNLMYTGFTLFYRSKAQLTLN